MKELVLSLLNEEISEEEFVRLYYKDYVPSVELKPEEYYDEASWLLDGSNEKLEALFLTDVITEDQYFHIIDVLTNSPININQILKMILTTILMTILIMILMMILMMISAYHQFTTI